MSEKSHRIVGTIKGVKGHCTMGHKVGDRFNLSGYSPDGLCGYFYHDLFPFIVMLEYGGGFPSAWGNPDVMTWECIDKANAVTIELQRLKD
ncbi:MAG: TIGR04076 family protein [Chloroflexi bacterium]|nr:TIGR04076 family protein [Chloroflexota bacterium]